MKAKFIGKAKLSKQGQITLPFEARKDLGIELDEEIYWYELGNSLIVVRDLVNPKDLNLKIRKPRGKRKR